MTDYPDELDTDDIEELAAYIERRYPTEELRFHDTETIHLGYWDKSHRIVSAMLLDHIQAAGYRVLHAGVATIPRGETRRAWMECRKHEPHEDADENETNSISLSCGNCEEEFTPDTALSVVIFGPGEARYTCPWCSHRTNGPPPIPNTK